MRQCPSLPLLWLRSARRFQGVQSCKLTPLAGGNSAEQALEGSHTFSGFLLYLCCPGLWAWGLAFPSHPNVYPEAVSLHSCTAAS